MYLRVNQMQEDQDRSKQYDATIDSSMEASLQKALAIFAAEQKANDRKIQRPDIDPRSGLMKIALTLLFFCALFIGLHCAHISMLVGLPLVLLVLLLTAKKTALWLILLYQKYAPEQMRASCVFTPSCSQYMMLAIQKYGLLRGVLKGTRRLLRCHPPNGGIDEP